MKLTLLLSLTAVLTPVVYGQAPSLVTEADSTRAIAYEAVTLKPQPFNLKPSVDFSGDGITRVVLFAQHLPSGTVKVQARDVQGHTTSLPVESVITVENMPDLWQVTVKLPESLPADGDVIVQLEAGSLSSNFARLGVGHTGDGPLDYTSAAPAPYIAPPQPITKIQGLILNLRVGSLTGNIGGDVGRWPDGSTGRNDALQPDASKRPVLLSDSSGSFLRFNPSAALLPTVRMTDVRTAIFVVRHSTNLQRNAPLLSDSSAVVWGGGGFHFEGNLFDYQPPPFGSGTSAPIRGGTVRINGRSVNPLAAPKPAAFSVISIVTTDPMPADMILSERLALGRGWDGDVKEIALFNRVLSAAELDSAEREVKDRNNVGPLAGLIVFDGNSLTAAQSEINEEHSAPGLYPYQTIAKLNLAEVRYDWLQYGVGGQTTQDMLSDAKTQIDPVIDPARPINIVIAWEGTNDLFRGASGLEAFDHMKTYCQGRRAAGAKVIVVNTMPGKPTFVEYPPTWDKEREAYNALLKSRWREIADRFVDLTADSQLGCASCPNNREIFADGVHLTPAGYGLVADHVKDAVLALQ